MLLLEALRDGKPSVRLALTPPCAPPCYDEVYDGSCLEEAEGAETATLTLALTLTPTLTLTLTLTPTLTLTLILTLTLTLTLGDSQHILDNSDHYTGRESNPTR